MRIANAALVGQRGGVSGREEVVVISAAVARVLELLQDLVQLVLGNIVAGFWGATGQRGLG